MSEQWDESHLMRDAFRVPPWPIYSFGIWLLSSLQLAKRCIEPPPTTLFDMVRGSWRSQILYTVAALHIADILGREGPQTSQQLAESIGVSENRLYRTLRAAVQIGLFEVVMPKKGEEHVRFKNNKRSALLREGHPNCLKHMVLHMTDHNKPAWDELLWGVRTGDPPFEYTHNGMSEFEWLKANPSEEDKFSKAMKEVDSLGLHVAVVDYNWNRHGRIIDIGGAYGSFLASILAKHAKPQGVLFDQSQVIRRAEEVWREDEGLAAIRDRTNFVAGDFFDAETLPAGLDGDAYLLRLILHDWSDEDSIAILSSVRHAIGKAKARLLIVETTMGDEFNDPLFQRALMDVHMMVCLNGHERTVPEWKELLAAAGFRFTRLIKTRGVFSLVEAVPAKLPKRPESSEGSSVDLQRYKSHGVISVDFDPADLENEP